MKTVTRPNDGTKLKSDGLYMILRLNLDHLGRTTEVRDSRSELSTRDMGIFVSGGDVAETSFGNFRKVFDKTYGCSDETIFAIREMHY